MAMYSVQHYFTHSIIDRRTKRLRRGLVLPAKLVYNVNSNADPAVAVFLAVNDFKER